MTRTREQQSPNALAACQACGNRLHVLAVRQVGDGIRRWKQCPLCGRRSVTIEKPAEQSGPDHQAGNVAAIAGSAPGNLQS